MKIRILKIKWKIFKMNTTFKNKKFKVLRIKLFFKIRLIKISYKKINELNEKLNVLHDYVLNLNKELEKKKQIKLMEFYFKELPF